MTRRWIVVAAALLVGVVAPLAQAQFGSKPKPRTKSLLVRVSTSLNKQSAARKQSPILARTTAPKSPARNSALNRIPPRRAASEILNRDGPARIPAGILDRPAPAYPKSKILARKIKYTPASPNILSREVPARANRTRLDDKPPARSNNSLIDRVPPRGENNTYMPSGPARPLDGAAATIKKEEPFPGYIKRYRNALAESSDPATRAYVEPFDKLVAKRDFREAAKLYREAAKAEKARKAALRRSS
jgi:hypothetical protein